MPKTLTDIFLEVARRVDGSTLVEQGIPSANDAREGY